MRTKTMTTVTHSKITLLIIVTLLCGVVPEVAADSQVLVLEPAEPVPGFPPNRYVSLNYVSLDGQTMLLQVWDPVWRIFSLSWNPATSRWEPVDASGDVSPQDLGFPNWTGGACISPDGLTMYYGDGTTQVSRSRKTEDGWTLPPEHIPDSDPNPTSTYFNGIHLYSEHLNTDLWTAEYDPDDDSFSPSVPVAFDPSQQDTSQWWESTPWVSLDGTLLVFASDRPGGYGGLDLWTATWDEQEQYWTNICNLGPNINTQLDEKHPCLTELADEKILYFNRGSSATEIQIMQALVSEPPCALDWSRIADLPSDQHAACAAVIDGLVYLVGGINPSGPVYNKMRIYDPTTDSWADGPPMPTRRLSLGSAVIDGPEGPELYVVGGYSGSAGLPTVERYIVSQGIWQTVASLSEPRGNAIMTAVVNNNLYAIGGHYNWGIRYATNEVYDRDNNVWLEKAPITKDAQPFPLPSGLPAVWDNKIFIFGGYPGYGPITTTLIYDTLTDTWSEGAEMPRGRAGSRAVTFGNYIYLIGGAADQSKIIDVYDPVNDSWSEICDYSGSNSHYPVIAQSDNLVYVLGDTYDNPAGQMECWVGHIPEPPCGLIAFVAAYDGDNDIWAVRPDGTDLKQLTNLVGHELSPEWSPDSTKIAYVYYAKGQIWVYDWLTGGNTKIYDANDHEPDYVYLELPAWSPDGSKILFGECVQGGILRIAVINADGMGKAVIPTEPGYVAGPSWCPSSTAFVYDRRNSGASYTHDLWIYDFTATGDIMNGTNIRLTEGASSESTTKFNSDWMPSGDIAFCWGHNLVLINPGQSPNWTGPVSSLSDPCVTPITTDASYPPIRYSQPSWSPDISQIVYTDESAGKDADLWIIDAVPDGSRHCLVLGTMADWGCPPPPCEVEIDIKPESCPNPLNVKSKGNISVAILGSEDFDANAIDPASVRLKYGDDSEGVAPLRSSLEDVATPVADGDECECNEDGPDGYTDLTVKFDTQLVLAAIGDVNNGDVLPLNLTGVLNDGTPIEGTDCMVVVGNFKAFKKGDINKDGITNIVDFTLMAETWLQSTVEDN